MAHKYSKVKIFHYPEKLASLPQSVEKILPPLHIRIKPTNFCAHNCYYCSYRSSEQQLGKDMNAKDIIPKEKMLQIVDDISEMGVKAVTFSGGGDPFYYPHLLPVAKKLAQTNVKFAAITNGARLSGELAEIFAANATWLRISIDGWDDRSYAEYRGIKEGEFSKLIKNMASFKQMSGKCYLGAVIIVDQKNAEHLLTLIRELKTTGVDSVKISPCIVSNDGKSNNEYHRPIYNVAKELTQQAIDECADDNFEIFDTYHLLDEKFYKPYTWCPYEQILPVIGADMNVYTCHDKAYNLECGLIGSIKNISFKDFWQNDKEKFFKINPSVDCNHHCVVNAINTLLLDYLDGDPKHREFV